MVPDMVHTPTWDKMFSIPSMQSIHTELKLSVMARGLLMLPSCMELMAMLPPTTMVATLTLMVPSSWARGLLMLSQRLMLLFCVELMVMLFLTHMDTLATSDTLPAGYPTTPPVSSASMFSTATYSFEPSIEQSQ